MLENTEIRLRTVEPIDLDILLEWENDISNWKVSDTKVPFSKKLMMDYINSAQDIFLTQQIRFMIIHKSSTQYIGCVDLFDYDVFHQRAGVGILIDNKFRKRGFAKQALTLLLEYGGEVLNLHQVYCTIHASNTESVNLFKNVGFIQTGTKKDWYNYKGVWEDELFFQKILS